MSKAKPYAGSAVLFALFVVAAALSGAAQTGTSFTLQGRVFDEAGAVLPGASVTVRNVSLGLTRTTVTDNEGRYIFAALPPTGQYEISVELSGFASERKVGLTFEANTSAVIDFVLKVGTLEEKITVTAQAPLVSTTKSEISNVIDEKRVAELPLNGRNFFEYVRLTPGAVRVGSGSGNLTLNGQGRRQLTILADGVTNQLREIRTLSGDLAGGNGTFSLDVVKEVQVITNAFSAEFGRSPSGVINVITRSGTNELHGSGFFYLRPGKLDAKNALTRRNRELNRQQWGLVLGGPIVRDKTHFLYNYEGTNEEQKGATITSILEPQPNRLVEIPFNEFKMMGKIDHQLTPSNLIEGRYNILRSTARNQGIGGLNTSERAFTAIDNFQSLVLSAISVISPRAVNELRFAWTKGTVDFFQPIVGRKLPPDFSRVGPAVNRAGVGNTGPNPAFPQNLRETGLQWIEKVSHTIGRHNLKYGGDIQSYFRFVTFFNNFVGTYTFAPGTPFPFNPNDPRTFPRSYSQSFGQSGLNFDELLLALFVQDDFNAAPGLTFNLGLRYEYETLMRDAQNFAPRFGFAWDPWGKGKSVIRGSYGIFFATIESSLINRESNFGPEGIVTIFLVPGDPLFPVFPNRFASLPQGANIIRNEVFIPIVRGLSKKDFPRSVGDKFGGLRVNPYSQQANLSIQTALGNDLALSIGYTMVRGLKLHRTRDLNAPPFFAVGPGRTRSLAQADAQRPFGVPSRVPGPLGIDFGGFRRLLIQESGDQSFYHAMRLSVTKRFSRNFSFEAHYTLSKAISDSDNFREADSLHVDPSNLKLDRGLSDQDRRHNFIAYGIWELPFGFRLGGIFSAVSGFPYSGLVGFDANGDGGPRDRPGALGRNTFRSRGSVNFDANLTKVIRIAEGHQLEARVELFNLGNNVNVTAVDQSIGLDVNNPASNFGRPTAVAPAREFQFSLRYSF